MSVRTTHVAIVLIGAALIGGCGAGQGSTPAQSPVVGASMSSPMSSASPAASSVLLGAADIDRPLTPGSYRIGGPFDAPFSIAFPTEWTLKSLSKGDVSFQNTQVNGGTGAAWLGIDRVDTVYDDPCHGGPINPPVPSTVEGLVAALTTMIGFTPGAISDVVIAGHHGKAVEITNAIDTQTTGCSNGPMLPMWTIAGVGPAATNGGSRENLWVIDVDGAPLLIDGTMFIPSTPEASRSEIGQIVQTLRFGSAPPAPVPSVAFVETDPGLVDIGGRSLFMECRGTRSPTVIFLAGTQMARTAMRGVEDGLLASSVRVCDYDRAGEGESDPASEPQTDLDVVDDLAALLKAADIPPPYVLVGHSVGGDQTWLYASRHPAGIAGFMIMNAGFFELDWESLHDVWSDQEIADERASAERGLGSVKQAASPPEVVPFVVMMSTIAQCGSPTDICGRIYPFYEDWARELAGRTKSGRFVSVEAGHEIYRSQPDRVIEEIRQLLDEVR
jgi:pimeloyl-ACP methyl ester carboxylesterase